VARRLGAESPGLVFGARVPTDDLAGLPELEVGGLRRSDARALLDLALAGPIEARVRDQIVAERQLRVASGQPDYVPGRQGFSLGHTAVLQPDGRQPMTAVQVERGPGVRGAPPFLSGEGGTGVGWQGLLELAA
jgi:hypothetical protein